MGGSRVLSRHPGQGLLLPAPNREVSLGQTLKVVKKSDKQKGALEKNHVERLKSMKPDFISMLQNEATRTQGPRTLWIGWLGSVGPLISAYRDLLEEKDVEISSRADV